MTPSGVRASSRFLTEGAGKTADSRPPACPSACPHGGNRQNAVIVAHECRVWRGPRQEKSAKFAAFYSFETTLGPSHTHTRRRPSASGGMNTARKPSSPFIPSQLRKLSGAPALTRAVIAQTTNRSPGFRFVYSSGILMPACGISRNACGSPFASTPLTAICDRSLIHTGSINCTPEPRGRNEFKSIIFPFSQRKA